VCISSPHVLLLNETPSARARQVVSSPILVYSSAGVRGTDCLTARIGMSHLRLGERKNPNPASLRDKRYRPLQRHQQPIRKPNKKIDVDACPQEPRREP